MRQLILTSGKKRNSRITESCASCGAPVVTAEEICSKPEHRQVDAILRTGEQKLTQIVEASAIPVFVIDSAHNITHWNKACEALTGISAEDMIGKADVGSAFYGEPRPVIANFIVDGASIEEVRARHLNNCYESKLIDGAIEAEGFFPKLGKSGRWLYFTGAPLRDSKNNVVGAVETLQDITKRKVAQQALEKAYTDLQTAQSVLEEKNIVLRGVLEQIEADKTQKCQQLQTNIDKIVLPMLRRLRDRIGPEGQDYVDLVQNSLEEISDPYTQKLETRFSRLSPRELEVCNMIRNGLSSKEICSLLNTSIETVHSQRKSIRKKLGVARGKVNLGTVLQNM